MPNGRDIKWERIRKENLSVDYGILLSPEECDRYLALLEAEVQYYDGDLSKVRVFGKWHPIPRQQVAFGEKGLTYKFSGNRIPAKDWTKSVVELKNIVEEATGFRYNFVLVNRYRDGNDYIGACRDFHFRVKNQRNVPTVKMVLENGSLLLMNHPTNVYWHHSLPKRSACKSVRVNLTFRNIIKT